MRDRLAPARGALNHVEEILSSLVPLRNGYPSELSSLAWAKVRHSCDQVRRPYTPEKFLFVRVVSGPFTAVIADGHAYGQPFYERFAFSLLRY
jgi:hypothetical protein